MDIDYQPFKIDYNYEAHHTFQTFRAYLLYYFNIIPQPVYGRPFTFSAVLQG